MQAAFPEIAWEFYLLLTRVEQAFKDLKGTLSIRPIWHQLEKDVSLLFAQLGLTLLGQPPPKVYATGQTGL